MTIDYTKLLCETLPNWLSAIGTVGAVLVALFHKQYRNWSNRPKLEITCGKGTPYIEELEYNIDSSTNEKEIRIRLRVENLGKNTADHCMINVDAYYKKRDKDDSFVKTDLTPAQIHDYRNNSLSYVVSKLVYYLDLAVIRKTDEMSRSEEGNKSKQFYKLFLLADRMATRLGKGIFIIPVKFFCPRIEPIVKYVKIYWVSDDYSTHPNDFSVEILTEDEFNKIKIAE